MKHLFPIWVYEALGLLGGFLGTYWFAISGMSDHIPVVPRGGGAYLSAVAASLITGALLVAAPVYLVDLLCQFVLRYRKRSWDKHRIR